MSSEEKLREVVGTEECPICLDSPVIPVCLACCHLFCRECLDRVEDKRCPLCREQYSSDNYVFVNDHEGPDCFEFQRILGVTLCGQEIKYLVEWRGGSITSEPRENLPQSCVREFKRRMKKERGNWLRTRRSIRARF